MERALSFGAVAEAYERFRPDYPYAIVTLAADAAEGAVITAVEVGAGTGKATRVFARAGIEVTATEPDEAMLAVLTRVCAGLPVRPMSARFEDLDPAGLGTFDLLYAAAAWHWTDPATRMDRAAALVRPGGAVALLGGPAEIADERLATTEAELTARYLPGGASIPPPTTGTGGLDWPGDDLLADRRFEDVRQRVIQRRYTVAREDHLGYLRTVSAYRLMSGGDRRALFDELRAALPDEVAVEADIVVHTARRV